MSASTERKNRQAARAAGTDKKTLAAREAEQKSRVSRRKWTIGTIAVVLCIALVLFLSSPLFYRLVTAESVGSRRISAAEANYNVASTKNSMNYDLYATYFGQEYADEMLAQTLESSLVQSTALLQYAKDNGISLSALEKDAVAESLDAMMDQIAEAAKVNGISSATYLGYVYGKGVNKGLIRSGMEDSVLVNKAYFTKFCDTGFPAEELAAYYENPADGDLFTYAVYLVTVGETRTAAEAEAAAKAVEMSYTDGKDADPDPLTVLNDILAEEFPGESATSRTDVLGANLDETNRAWLTDSARSAGDITVQEAPDGTGWYVVLFLDREDNTEPAVAVRHILIMAEADEEGVYTDEAKAAAKARAEEILAGWEAGEKTEADFATLAYLYSDDSGSRANGGLYSAVTKGQMVEEFDAFCFAEHQYGDTAIVYGESDSYAGYHVMFFVEQSSARDAAARDSLRNDAMTEWFAEITDGLEVKYHWAYKLVG